MQDFLTKHPTLIAITGAVSLSMLCYAIQLSLTATSNHWLFLSFNLLIAIVAGAVSSILADEDQTRLNILGAGFVLVVLIGMFGAAQCIYREVCQACEFIGTCSAGGADRSERAIHFMVLVPLAYFTGTALVSRQSPPGEADASELDRPVQEPQQAREAGSPERPAEDKGRDSRNLRLIGVPISPDTYVTSLITIIVAVFSSSTAIAIAIFN